MDRRTVSSRPARVALAGILALAIAGPAWAANIVLVNLDPPGEGLNDPTPVAPVGGNPGTTLGEQRINVYLFAGDLWGKTLESDVDVFVGATFTPLACTTTSAVLGAAGATFVFANFPGAQFPDLWYHSALADAQAGLDLNPGQLDIISFFNSRIGTDPSCLSGRGWYYGLDNDQGTDLDFLSVVAHEIGHGLGFSNFVNEATGALLAGRPDIFSKLTYDVTTGKTWDVMTQAERAASAVNDRNVVWIGVESTAQAQDHLGPRPSLKILQPTPLRGQSWEVQPASFGSALRGGGGVTGKLVLADDGVGATADACEPLIGDLEGQIVLAYRGTCTFVAKALNAQAAGAKGIVIANNVAVGLPGMGGADPAVTITAVGISQAHGDALEAALPQANVRLFLDPAHLAGTVDGFVRIYAPNPVQPGSSGSHWDVTTTPNLLMEPFITPDLESAVSFDLTPALMHDVGWVLQP